MKKVDEVSAKAFTQAEPQNKDSNGNGNDSLFIPDPDAPVKRNRNLACVISEKEIDDHIFKSINSLAAALQAQQDEEIEEAFSK